MLISDFEFKHEPMSTKYRDEHLREIVGQQFSAIKKCSYIVSFSVPFVFFSFFPFPILLAVATNAPCVRVRN